MAAVENQSGAAREAREVTDGNQPFLARPMKNLSQLRELRGEAGHREDDCGACAWTKSAMDQRRGRRA